MRLSSLGLLLVLVSCAPSATVLPLIRSAGVPTTRTPTGAVPLEVVTRGTDVHDPLPVAGSGVAVAELEAALGHAIGSATVPWADEHRQRRPEGWQLFVELIKAEAHHDRGRTAVTLDVRATLRTRKTREFLAQYHSACHQAALVPAAEATPVFYSCMEQIGRDLASWLGSVDG